MWLDPLVVRSFAFISHAHTDHARRHKEALLTPQTLALIPEARRPRGWRMLGYRRADAARSCAPSPCIRPGTCSALRSCSSSTRTRGCCTPATSSCGSLEATRTHVPKAHVLVLESTYGRPHFRFGDPDSTVEAIARWCRLALDSRVTPVLLCHALGKTEEIMLALAGYGFTFALEKRCVPLRARSTDGGPSPPGLGRAQR